MIKTQVKELLNSRFMALETSRKIETIPLEHKFSTAAYC